MVRSQLFHVRCKTHVSVPAEDLFLSRNVVLTIEIIEELLSAPYTK